MINTSVDRLHHHSRSRSEGRPLPRGQENSPGPQHDLEESGGMLVFYDTQDRVGNRGYGKEGRKSQWYKQGQQ